MYKKIVIENLRGIKHLEIDDLRQFNLFVGDNNSGKTTVLEGLFLLIGATNPELPLRINLFREFPIVDQNAFRAIFNKLDVNSKIKISGELENPEENRELTIKPHIEPFTPLPKHKTKEDMMTMKDSFSGLEPTITGLDLDFNMRLGTKKQKKYIKTKAILEGKEIKIDRPTKYKDPINGSFLTPTNIFVGDLPKKFDKIQVDKKVDDIVKILSKMDPSLSNLSLGGGGIIYCDIGLDKLIPINMLGAGTFKLFSIVLGTFAIQNGVLLVDEIENGFYHIPQHILWDAIFKSAKEFNVQIFATTHSIECVKAFSSSYSQLIENTDQDDIRLHRIEREGDVSRVVSYDHKTLETAIDRDWEMR